MDQTLSAAREELELAAFGAVEAALKTSGVAAQEVGCPAFVRSWQTCAHLAFTACSALHEDCLSMVTFVRAPDVAMFVTVAFRHLSVQYFPSSFTMWALAASHIVRPGSCERVPETRRGGLLRVLRAALLQADCPAGTAVLERCRVRARWTS